MVQNMVQWQAIVHTIMKLQVSIKCRKYLEHLRDYKLLKNHSDPWRYLCLAYNDIAYRPINSVFEAQKILFFIRQHTSKGNMRSPEREK
jgi:hypothetical protein